MQNWQFITLLLSNVLINGTVAFIAWRIGVYHKQKMDAMETQLTQAIKSIETMIKDPATFKALGAGIVETVASDVVERMHGMWGATKAQLYAGKPGEGPAPNIPLAVMDVFFSRGKKKALLRNAPTFFPEDFEAVSKIIKDPAKVIQEYSDHLSALGKSPEEAIPMIEAKAKELGYQVNIGVEGNEAETKKVS